jgi:hypothetical protein
MRDNWVVGGWSRLYGETPASASWTLSRLKTMLAHVFVRIDSSFIGPNPDYSPESVAPVFTIG